MTSDGAVTWGLNDNGQLGNNSTTNQNVPVKVLVVNIVVLTVL